MPNERGPRGEKRPRLAAFFAGIRADRYAFAVLAMLFLCVLAIIVHSAVFHRWNRVFTGTLTLFLLLLPPLAEQNFRIHLPTTLEILAYMFVFCAGVLGEIAGFYERFAWWDDILHACNGFMFAAFGFCLVALTERSRKKSRSYPPFLITFVAFCFSMTVGALWELFEYSVDMLLHTDMQKDTQLTGIHTVTLPNGTGERVTHITEIASTVIVTKGGERVEISGYLDIGLADTMVDLAVNLAGTLLFCVIGYFYLKRRRGALAAQFIPTVMEKC